MLTIPSPSNTSRIQVPLFLLVDNPLVKSLTVPEEPEKDSLGNFIVGKWTSAPKKDG